MTFSLLWQKYLRKTTWGEKESYSSALWCSPSWWGRSNKQGLETADHISPTVRRQTVTRIAGLGYAASRTAPSDPFFSNNSSIPKAYTTFQKVPPAGNQVTKHINLWDFVFHISYSNYIRFFYWYTSPATYIPRESTCFPFALPFLWNFTLPFWGHYISLYSNPLFKIWFTYSLGISHIFMNHTCEIHVCWFSFLSSFATEICPR